MTTKYKIVTGFVVMLLLLFGSSLVGYRALKTSSDNFTAFNDLARLNVLLSEMSSETYAQAYALERFLQRQGPEYMQKAVAHQRRAAELSREGVLHVKTPAMRDRMEDLHADMTAYVMLLEDMQDNALEWMDVYENDFEPHMYALYEAMEAMSAAGENSGNLSSINGLWANTSQMGMQLGSLIPASSEQTLEQAVSPMRNCRQLLDALNVASFSDAQRAPHDKYVASLAAMENALENNKHRALKLAADLGKTYEYDERVLNASLDMASLVDERMAEEADVIAGSNAAGMRNSLIISGIGFVLAIILATVIIMSLMRVLQQSTAYASTISDGNFDYEPNIREKGEIGGLIGALSGIPQTLKRIRSEYSNLERNVEQGELLAHGQPEQFPGEFASLVRGTDNIINRFRIVLENIPSPVIMLNKDLKATYLNAVARELAGEEYRGKTCYELFRREDFDTDQDGLMRAVNTKRAATGETRAYPNGRAMDIRYTAIPMLDENNNIVSVLQLITDFTELKSQQEAMQRMTEKAMMISERVASASAQLAEKVEKVSTDADLQRERVESAASAMTQMNSAVLEVARGAGQASQQSDEARSNAENGAELVQELVFAINEVNNVAMRLQENMELLDSQVDNIGKVMDVITDIADQTNLLALNAAIEAAHAGEAGRGFAVVADEVRKLAEKTMQATEEVAANVEAIQQSSRANMAEVSATVEKVSAVTRLAEESGDALQGIVQLASETSGHVSSIAAAAEQQSASSEEIAHSLEELNMLVRTTSEEMMESSESVQELASTAQDLKNVLDGV